MSNRFQHGVLVQLAQKGALASLILSVTALLAAPAWAQRGGQSGGPPMRMPPMSIPRMSPPMRQAPMPRAMPPARPPRNLPRNDSSPNPVFHAPPERMPNGGSNAMPAQNRSQANSGRSRKFGSAAHTAGPPRGYIPASAEGARMPVYTPMTSSSYRARVSAMRADQNQHAIPGYYSPADWAGYAWNPFFFGGDFFDPFDSPFFLGSGCFGFSPFGNLVFVNPFLGFSCGGPFAPALFEPSCLFCNGFGFDSFALGLNNAGFLDTLPASSSFSLSGGTAFSSAVPPLSSATSSTALTLPAPGAPPAGASALPTLSSSTFATNQPPASEPLTLVFTNGSTAQATEYWPGNDGNLHYVTSLGDKITVPLDHLDMSATMAANRRQGIQFLAPSPVGPEAPQRKP